jgi:hypothetical protein
MGLIRFKKKFFGAQLPLAIGPPFAEMWLLKWFSISHSLLVGQVFTWKLMKASVAKVSNYFLFFYIFSQDCVL